MAKKVSNCCLTSPFFRAKVHQFLPSFVLFGKRSCQIKYFAVPGGRYAPSKVAAAGALVFWVRHTHKILKCQRSGMLTIFFHVFFFQRVLSHNNHSLFLNISLLERKTKGKLLASIFLINGLLPLLLCTQQIVSCMIASCLLQ